MNRFVKKVNLSKVLKNDERETTLEMFSKEQRDSIKKIIAISRVKAQIEELNRHIAVLDRNYHARQISRLNQALVKAKGETEKSNVTINVTLG